MSDEKIDLVITLFVAPGHQPPDTGFTNVVASNGETYGFKFTGGNTAENDGSIDEETNLQASHIKIEIDRNSRSQFIITGGGVFGKNPTAVPQYDSLDVSFTYVQSTTFESESGIRWAEAIILNDANSHDLNSDYVIYVYDHDNNAHIPCDPSIRNRPSKVQ